MKGDLDRRHIQTSGLGIDWRLREGIHTSETNGADEARDFSAISLGVDRFFQLPIFAGLLRLQLLRSLFDFYVINIVNFEIQNLLVAKVGDIFRECLRPIAGSQENVASVRSLGVVVRFLGILASEKNLQRLSILRFGRDFDRGLLQAESREILPGLTNSVFTLNSGNVRRKLLPFVRIGFQSRGRGDLPTLLGFFYAGDRTIRVRQADLRDVLVLDLKYFLLRCFL